MYAVARRSILGKWLKRNSSTCFRITSAGLCIHVSDIFAHPSLIPRNKSPASSGPDSRFLYIVRGNADAGALLLYIFSKSSFDLFQIGQIVKEVGESEESGAPI